MISSFKYVVNPQQEHSCMDGKYLTFLGILIIFGIQLTRILNFECLY